MDIIKHIKELEKAAQSAEAEIRKNLEAVITDISEAKLTYDDALSEADELANRARQARDRAHEAHNTALTHITSALVMIGQAHGAESNVKALAKPEAA